MSLTPEQQKELQRTSQLFHAALVEMGAHAVGDALAIWQDVPPLPSNATTLAQERWLKAAVKYVMAQRVSANDLALSYYRYQRAVATGATIALPGEQPPKYESLLNLRHEFETLVSANTQNASQTALRAQQGNVPQTVQESVRSAPVQPEGNVEDDGDEQDENDRVLVEMLNDLDNQIEENDRTAEQQANDILQTLGPDNMDRKIAKAKPQTPEEVDASRQQAHQQAGNRQAATAARLVMNGARGTLFDVVHRDRASIGYVRVSRTGTPCGWCAMLISRGPVYKSAASAQFNDGDLYHDNCQCYAVPVFSTSQYESNPLFDLNRQYSVLWPKVTKGLGGDAALSAWRKYIRQQATQQEPSEAAA